MTTDALAFLQSAIQWTAILLAALAGAYEARRRDLDFFGTLVIAFVVSVGGGTLRDVLLARYPLFWVQDPVYVISVFCVTAVGVLVMTPREQVSPALDQLVKPVQRAMRSDHIPTWVIVIDALGLGLFAYLGTNFALEAGASRLCGAGLWRDDGFVWRRDPRRVLRADAEHFQARADCMPPARRSVRSSTSD